MHRFNVIPDLCILVLSLGLQAVLTKWLLELPAWRTRPRLTLLFLANVAYACLSLLGYLFGFARFWRFAPMPVITWIHASTMILTVLLMGLCAAFYVRRTFAPVRPDRRRLLKASAMALATAPPVATAFGILIRNDFTLKEVKVRIPDLHPDLNGLKLVQVTDIHLGPFLDRRQFARAIDMANETKAHLALVTGDLITAPGDPLDDCIGELARLRADAGAIGCMGNHEHYANCEDYVQRKCGQIGIDFLRNRARSFRFGNALLNFTGVDYQSFYKTYLDGAENFVQPGQLNVLLSHNPDVFPVAVKKGYDLTIAGHTHGGQVNFEILNQNVNVARAFTHYVRGLYQRGNSSIYVSSGVGTIGVPVRLGAPPEISLIQLCAS